MENITNKSIQEISNFIIKATKCGYNKEYIKRLIESKIK